MTTIEEQARPIFLGVLEREPDQWPPFLDEACGGSGELRARVEQLLRAHHAMGSIHAHRAEAPVATIDEATVAERPGSLIGPYKLIEPIGEGGMGTVWLAQQTEPVKRLVALKLIKAGMDSKQVIARFEAERQALAIMRPDIVSGCAC
jgi:serine/threonine protein kinase